MSKREELSQKTVEELREIADGMGLKVHHKAGPDKIVDAIMAEIAPVEENSEIFPVGSTLPEGHLPQAFVENDGGLAVLASKPAPVAPAKASNDIQAAIVAATEGHRLRGMVVTFPDENSWHFKSGFKEDSGSITSPISRIRRCADLVCKPAKAPTTQRS